MITSNRVDENAGLVSVIMPVFNVRMFIKQAITSILNQTYQNLELIVIDDFSTDGTFDIIEEIQKTDNRVILIRNAENLKIAESLNNGLKFAKGEYILRMDGDDVCSEDRIEIMLSYLRNNPKCDLVGSFMRIINENGDIIGSRPLVIGFENLMKIIKVASPVPHIWMCRRIVYDLVGPYRFPGVEDYDFLLRMITLGMKFDNIPSYLYSVRIRNGNTSTTIGYRQYMSAKIVYSLYKDRLKLGFELERKFNENIAKEQRYSYALNNVRLGLENFRNRHYIHFLYFILVSFIFAPKIVISLTYDRIVFNLYLRFFQ